MSNKKSKIDFSKLKEIASMDIKDIGTLFKKEENQNANIKSDIANAKNIQSAVVALVGDGEISNGATFTVTSADNKGGSKVVNYLQNEPKGKASKAKGNAFQVEVDSTGNVKVFINEGGTPVQVYPQLIGSETYSEK